MPWLAARSVPSAGALGQLLLLFRCHFLRPRPLPDFLGATSLQRRPRQPRLRLASIPALVCILRPPSTSAKASVPLCAGVQVFWTLQCCFDARYVKCCRQCRGLVCVLGVGCGSHRSGWGTLLKAGSGASFASFWSLYVCGRVLCVAFARQWGVAVVSMGALTASLVCQCAVLERCLG